MAPIISEATAAVVLAALISTKSSATAVDGKGKCDNGAARPRRQRQLRQRPITAANKVLAWGGQQRRQTDNTNQIQFEADLTTRPSLDEAAYPKAKAADGSWTHAAFRAFHEMRAGRPPQSAFDQVDEVDDAGPLAGFRRLTAGLNRSFGGALGQKGDGGKQQQRRGDGKLVVRAAEDDGTSAKTATRSTERSVTTAPGKKNPPACWHMRGRLTNAATGQTIALVEGVELSRSLAFETAPGKRERRITQTNENVATGALHVGGSGKRSGGRSGGRGKVENPTPAAAASGNEEEEEELEVDRVLKKPGVWTAFGALASSKFFMYQDPDTGEPMEYFRNTPVEKKQMVRTYERFSQIVSHLLQPNGRVLVVSEWGGRAVKAETANINGVEELGAGGGNGFLGGGRLGKGARGRGQRDESTSASPRRVFNLHFFVEARTPKEERELKRWQDRPGARWVAFGPTPPRAYGCKEVYSYVSGHEEADRAEQEEPKTRGKAGDVVAAGAEGGGSSASGGGGGGGGLMSYTRHGECPTWYGTGRMCGLDIQARRVDSFESLPAKLREKVREVDPEFEAGPPGTMAEGRLAARKEREAKEEERRKKSKISLRRPFGSWGSGNEL